MAHFSPTTSGFSEDDRNRALMLSRLMLGGEEEVVSQIGQEPSFSAFFQEILQQELSNDLVRDRVRSIAQRMSRTPPVGIVVPSHLLPGTVAVAEEVPAREPTGVEQSEAELLCRRDAQERSFLHIAIAEGNDDEAEELVRRSPNLLMTLDGEGALPGDLLIRQNRFDFLYKLLTIWIPNDSYDKPIACLLARFSYLVGLKHLQVTLAFVLAVKQDEFVSEEDVVHFAGSLNSIRPEHDPLVAAVKFGQPLRAFHLLASINLLNFNMDQLSLRSEDILPSMMRGDFCIPRGNYFLDPEFGRIVTLLIDRQLTDVVRALFQKKESLARHLMVVCPGTPFFKEVVGEIQQEDVPGKEGYRRLLAYFIKDWVSQQEQDRKNRLQWMIESVSELIQTAPHELDLFDRQLLSITDSKYSLVKLMVECRDQTFTSLLFKLLEGDPRIEEVLWDVFSSLQGQRESSDWQERLDYVAWLLEQYRETGTAPVFFREKGEVNQSLLREVCRSPEGGALIRLLFGSFPREMQIRINSKSADSQRSLLQEAIHKAVEMGPKKMEDTVRVLVEGGARLKFSGATETQPAVGLLIHFSLEFCECLGLRAFDWKKNCNLFISQVFRRGGSIPTEEQFEKIRWILDVMQSQVVEGNQGDFFKRTISEALEYISDISTDDNRETVSQRTDLTRKCIEMLRKLSGDRYEAEPEFEKIIIGNLYKKFDEYPFLRIFLDSVKEIYDEGPSLDQLVMNEFAGVLFNLNSVFSGTFCWFLVECSAVVVLESDIENRDKIGLVSVSNYEEMKKHHLEVLLQLHSEGVISKRSNTVYYYEDQIEIKLLPKGRLRVTGTEPFIQEVGVYSKKALHDLLILMKGEQFWLGVKQELSTTNYLSQQYGQYAHVTDESREVTIDVFRRDKVDCPKNMYIRIVASQKKIECYRIDLNTGKIERRCFDATSPFEDEIQAYIDETTRNIQKLVSDMDEGLGEYGSCRLFNSSIPETELQMFVSANGSKVSLLQRAPVQDSELVRIDSEVRGRLKTEFKWNFFSMNSRGEDQSVLDNWKSRIQAVQEYIRYYQQIVEVANPKGIRVGVGGNGFDQLFGELQVFAPYFPSKTYGLVSGGYSEVKVWIGQRIHSEAGGTIVFSFTPEELSEKLDQLQWVQAVLNGQTFSQAHTKTLAFQGSTISLPKEPAPVDLNLLLSHFDSLRGTEYLAGFIRRNGGTNSVSEEGLRATLGRLVNAVILGNGISGYEAGHPLYETIKIQLTHTFQPLQDPTRVDDLNVLVCELALYGSYCGPKIADTIAQNYALTYGLLGTPSQNNQEPGLEGVLQECYKNSALEVLQMLLDQVHDPQAERQIIHVLTYLRKILTERGYVLPDDPQRSFVQNQAEHDLWDNDYGVRAYGDPNLVPVFFEALLVPLLMQKLLDHQADLIEGRGKGEELSLLHKGVKEFIEANPFYLDEEERITLASLVEEFDREMALLREEEERMKQTILQKKTELGDCWVQFEGIRERLQVLKSEMKDMAKERLRLNKKVMQVQEDLSSFQSDAAVAASESTSRKRKITSVLIREGLELDMLPVLQEQERKLLVDAKSVSDLYNRKSREEELFQGLYQSANVGAIDEVVVHENRLKEIQEDILQKAKTLSSKKSELFEIAAMRNGLIVDDEVLDLPVITMAGAAILFRNAGYFVPFEETSAFEREILDFDSDVSEDAELLLSPGLDDAEGVAPAFAAAVADAAFELLAVARDNAAAALVRAEAVENEQLQ